MISAAPAKLLVLCVDRDNDLYEKTQIASPIIGRAACLNAAEALALSDPEEADANAIFAAVKEHDVLKLQGHDVEVSVITGTFGGGVESDTKIRQELMQVRERFPAEGVIFVSDGFEDETLVPIFQTIIPIFSIRRVIIKHSERVEESYAVLGKYLKMIVFDPRYSKYFLGFPGLFLLMFAGLVLIGFVNQAVIGALFFLGVLLIIRGFGVDTLLGNVRKLNTSSYIRVFSVLSMILLCVVGFYRGFVGLSVTEEFKIVAGDPSKLLENLSFLSGIMIENALLFVWIGVGIYYAGNILYTFIRESLYRAFRYTVGIVMLVLLYFPFIELSQILIDPNRNPFSVVSTLLIGLSLLFLLLSFAYLKIVRRKDK
jgi:putative membrane protein